MLTRGNILSRVLGVILVPTIYFPPLEIEIQYVPNVEIIKYRFVILNQDGLAVEIQTI